MALHGSKAIQNHIQTHSFTFDVNWKQFSWQQSVIRFCQTIFKLMCKKDNIPPGNHPQNISFSLQICCLFACTTSSTMTSSSSAAACGKNCKWTEKRDIDYLHASISKCVYFLCTSTFCYVFSRFICGIKTTQISHRMQIEKQLGWLAGAEMFYFAQKHIEKQTQRNLCSKKRKLCRNKWIYTA